MTLAPHFFDGHRGLGLLAGRSGDYAAALEYFSAARAVAPENPWLINDAANALRELGRLDEAEAGYRELMAKAPHIFDGPWGLGRVLRASAATGTKRWSIFWPPSRLLPTIIG